MGPDGLMAAWPPAPVRRRWALSAGARYWPQGRDGLERLPVPASSAPPTGRLVSVPLPAWASDLGVGLPEALLADAAFVVGDEGEPWARVDWWAAIFALANGWDERRHEERHGPIHSYAFRLSGIDQRRFDRAWVNRAMLFLRRWAAHALDRTEDELFGPLPQAALHLTHDVDAVVKTPELRLKQTAFHAFNAARALARGDLGRVARHLAGAWRFLALPGQYDQIRALCALEEQSGVRSSFHFYAGPPGWRRRGGDILLDPAYDVASPAMRAHLRFLAEGGWQVGLHQAYGSWKDGTRMAAEKARLEASLGAPATQCRQHWLRFSWHDTWRVQEACGIRLDGTLGFNDRSGFRNSAALACRPWDFGRAREHGLVAMPLVLMDSHLYDYGAGSAARPEAEVDRWLDEIAAVRGVAGVVWHQRVLHPDYDWGGGYRAVLARCGKDLRALDPATIVEDAA